MTDIDRAIEAFERATEGCLELDLMFLKAMGWKPPQMSLDPAFEEQQPWPHPSRDLQHAVEAVPEPFTWIVHSPTETKPAMAWIDRPCMTDYGPGSEIVGQEDGKTAPLALCRALLDALKVTAAE